ncbi:ACP S-malonyltransferase [Adhaeretor mobilis]|uniref:[acyl-carrier-protein] S-malonyltransferase n=1 Tax=Adhaeretor mobilis TaxID=1930276 RepID=A0A517MWS9_9BACT|nr:ACP S-malonyltransferase [Adhaeretor mobilis]QDS99340.1 Malonyl CoA-acyl carrier protein transacylase [Adhaeretor mobilis]
MSQIHKITQDRIADAALAFRGYNVTNLGRTVELLNVESYRSIIEEELARFGKVCEQESGRTVNLSELVRKGVEPTLEHYSEAIALVVATEVAHLRLLKEIHELDYSRVKHSFGYSLGELTAVCCGGVFAAEDVVRIPLAMAADCVKLSENTRMGVLFSRGPAIPEADVDRLCVTITSEGKGTIGISAILSPNTYLLIGQNETVARFKKQMHELLPHKAHLRMNSERWPPLHTPIVRQLAIPDRAAVLMQTLPGGLTPPAPPVVSLVTGRRSYDDHSGREVLRHWVDHPQRLWDAICETLSAGVETVIHVGPEPNVIPATFRRLAENVEEQTSSNTLESFRLRAVAGLARRSWLSAMLPSKASLLRAPFVKHVILEDWLIQNAPS